MIPLLALALTGCAPQDAQISGNWFVWLPANNSATITDEKLPGATDDATVFECSGRGWNKKTNDWDDGYIGPREDDDPTDPRWFGGDCNPDDSECTAVEEDMKDECLRIRFLDFFTELSTDGYYGLTGDLDPWRTEAVVNSEGDLQLFSHQRLGNGQDFRFHFSIKPDFSPVSCLDDDNGDPYIDYTDGQPWLDEWSRNDDGYTVYYLNGNSYQVPPNSTMDDTDNFWYMPTVWAAGSGTAKFAADEQATYVDPILSVVTDREALDDEGADQAIADAIADVEAQAQLWSSELTDVAGANIDGEPAFAFRVEDNSWRPIDRDSGGLDGYAEVHGSWVRIKNSSTIEEGGMVEGDYQILYGGIESEGILLVTGTFKIDKLRYDKWGYDILEDDKREENDSPFCGGAPMPE